MWGSGGGERRAKSSESLYSCFIFAGHLGEAGRNTAGRVIRRLSGWGWEEARAAEGGVKALSTSLDGHQPDVRTIWSRAGGGVWGEERRTKCREMAGKGTSGR